MGQIIRPGVAANPGSPVKLLGGKAAVPKGVEVVLGTGWTRKSASEYVFDVPPGAQFNPLQFQGLLIGGNYNLKFIATAQTGYGAMVFRPGELGLDLAINADGAYDHDFVANNTNGESRFLHTDVTGVTRITISGLKLVFTG